MAESFGFFEAKWDESVMNPVTEEYTGWWDVAYLWKDFMNYFALFVGNGVFVSPTNQLKVLAGSGLSVIVKQGWAFINGHWYHNNEDKILSIPANNTSSARIDSVKVRYSEETRSIQTIEFVNEVDVIRGETIYDLKLAEIIVQPNSITISNSFIEDTRGNTDVCGFVKGLLEVVSTEDLFAQFQSIFNDWFITVKDQVTGDLAIRLQMEFEQINKDLKEFYENVTKDISDYKDEMNQNMERWKKEVKNVADDAYDTIEKFVDDDFVIPLNSYTFVNKQCIISNSKITSASLIDVYWTKESIPEAMRCVIYVDSEDGRIVLTAGRQPSTSLSAVIRVRVK